MPFVPGCWHSDVDNRVVSETSRIHDAQENIAKLQGALDDAQQMLAAAERAQEAAEQTHEAAKAHAAMFRKISLIALGVTVVAVLKGIRRRSS